MKSTIQNDTNSNSAREYPCILQLKANKNIIVLFTTQGTRGIVLHVDGDPNRIGTIEHWLGSDTDYWQEFHGEVTLSN